MKRIPLLIIFLISLSQHSEAQLPVQVFAGHESIEYNFLWFKDVDQQGRISLFNFTFFDVNYEDEAANFSEIYQVGTYNFNKNWGIAAGGRYTGGRFVPLVALSFQVQTESLYFNIFPSLQYASAADELQYALFGLLFYTPKINDNWHLFSQLAFEPIFNDQQHLFTYQQLRLGLEYKKLIQFGIGANLQQIGIGDDFTFVENYGLFIRKELY
ncbi:MAG: hypothetical protein ACFB0B_14370 [Thermonemataceae bacterium]